MLVLSDWLGPEVANRSDLVGILNAGDLNAGWSQNVFGELEQMPQRLAELLALIDRLFGTPQADGPAVFPAEQWYPIKKSAEGARSRFYTIAPTKDPRITNGVIGIGVFNPIKGQNLVLAAYGFPTLAGYQRRFGAWPVHSDDGRTGYNSKTLVQHVPIPCGPGGGNERQ
jgi:hypothetical protein